MLNKHLTLFNELLICSIEFKNQGSIWTWSSNWEKKVPPKFIYQIPGYGSFYKYLEQRANQLK